MIYSLLQGQITGCNVVYAIYLAQCNNICIVTCHITQGLWTFFYLMHRRVIEGYEVLKSLEMIATYNERPQEQCQVSNCGVYQP